MIVACEMFVLELTLRSWIYTEENKRRTLQRRCNDHLETPVFLFAKQTTFVFPVTLLWQFQKLTCLTFWSTLSLAMKSSPRWVPMVVSSPCVHAYHSPPHSNAGRRATTSVLLLPAARWTGRRSAIEIETLLICFALISPQYFETDGVRTYNTFVILIRSHDDKAFDPIMMAQQQASFDWYALHPQCHIWWLLAVS